MDRAEYIQKRRRKYLAQVMEELEAKILPLLNQTSPETIEYVPKAGHKAVYWLQHPDSLRQKWERYGVLRADAGTPVSRPGQAPAG